MIQEGSSERVVKKGRREQTRLRITSAAHDCFVARGVAGTSVDDIVARAGISRATFYQHYSNKEAILLDLLREPQPFLLKIFARLRDLPDPTLEAVRRWLTDYVASVSAHRSVLLLSSLSGAYDDEPRVLLIQQQLARMALLGERYVAFAPPPDDVRGRTKAIMMMSEMEHFVSALAHDDILPDKDMALDIAAQRLRAFLLID